MPNSTFKAVVISLALSAAILSGMSCARRLGGRNTGRAATLLTIKGSDTMVHLVSAWAEEYMRQHPETEISVTGGGSGTGFAALLNGTTDICAASREIMPKETELAEARGIAPLGCLVARDGIAVVVHPTNPVSTLTVEQIGNIFSGAYDNWNQVGGADRQIVVLSRDFSSGTFVFFQDHVLLKRDFRPDARLLPATSAIVQSVAEDEGAIGYVGLGYALDARGTIKSLAVRTSEAEPACEPTRETVQQGRYPIIRPLRLFTSGEPTGLASSFLEFCLGRDGQGIVDTTGYVGVK